MKIALLAGTSVLALIVAAPAGAGTMLFGDAGSSSDGAATTGTDWIFAGGAQGGGVTPGGRGTEFGGSVSLIGGGTANIASGVVNRRAHRSHRRHGSKDGSVAGGSGHTGFAWASASGDGGGAPSAWLAVLAAARAAAAVPKSAAAAARRAAAAARNSAVLAGIPVAGAT